MTARKMLLGFGSPFPQTRVDFNLLHGTDSSSGTNPFTNPTNLNDGNDATHADRPAAPHASAYIVQSATENNTGAAQSHTDLPGAVTAGNLLILSGSKTSSGAIGFDSSSIFVSGSGLANPRPFAKFAADVFSAAGPPPFDPTVIGWRIATGDEQHLDLFSGNKFVIYEIANAGNASLFEVLALTTQAASSAKSLGPFSATSAVQILALNWGNSSTTVVTNQVLGTGYTQDIQVGTGVSGLGHPGFLGAHGTSGTTPQVISGQTEVWAAMAVAVTTNAADETSICEADLGMAFPVNRLTLLESVASGTQYAVSYSTDAITWTPLAPTFSAVGALQTYELAATIAARYWRIADNHSPAIALGALAWDTWTIQGFPL